MKDINFTSAQHVITEVSNMNVKGGSAFGRAAAWAYFLALEQEKLENKEALVDCFDYISSELLRLKPTMATIYNTKYLIYKTIETMDNAPIMDVKTRVKKLCKNIINHSLNAVELVGLYGANLIKHNETIMMHSYSSSIMSIFKNAANQGKKFTVICTESRPLRESKLAVQTLQTLNIPVIYITDASIWEFLPNANLIIMGADTIGWDGRVANKIGTSMISQLAQFCKKPVFIASEIYKLDRRTKSGHRIQLERRGKDEIISPEDFDNLDGIDIINQFFDITPAHQITGIITEFGVVAPTMISFLWDKFVDKISKV